MAKVFHGTARHNTLYPWQGWDNIVSTGKMFDGSITHCIGMFEGSARHCALYGQKRLMGVQGNVQSLPSPSSYCSKD